MMKLPRFLLLILVACPQFFALYIPLSLSFNSDTAIATKFYKLYSLNQTQEIFTNDDFTIKEKVRTFSKLSNAFFMNENNENGKEDAVKMNQMFNRTLYIKIHADAVLEDERLRKLTFKCYIADPSQHFPSAANMTVDEHIQLTEQCLYGMTTNFWKTKIINFVRDVVEWTKEFGKLDNPPEDFFFDHYHRNEIEAIMYDEKKTVDEKKGEILNFVSSANDLDDAEKVYLRTYYIAMVGPIQKLVDWSILLQGNDEIMKGLQRLSENVKELDKLVSKVDKKSN